MTGQLWHTGEIVLQNYRKEFLVSKFQHHLIRPLAALVMEYLWSEDICRSSRTTDLHSFLQQHALLHHIRPPVQIPTPCALAIRDYETRTEAINEEKYQQWQSFIRTLDYYRHSRPSLFVPCAFC